MLLYAGCDELVVDMNRILSYNYRSYSTATDALQRGLFFSLFEQHFDARQLDQLWVIAELLVVRLFCPENSYLGQNKCVTVYSKVCVVAKH